VTTSRPIPTPHFSGRYRAYVLGLLMLIYAVNFLDRQVISILAPSLKSAMSLTDAQLGLLFGTAFALFYGLMGLSLARLADSWNRVSTISIGLGFWSGMTALSGLSGNFTQLSLARIGVGVGEASASPAAFSLLQDYFPKEQRGTALSLYSSGIYIGSGLALVIGGSIITYWDHHFISGAAPLGLAGWQATFIAFGLPGILLALLAKLTIKEPPRALPAISPLRVVWGELARMIPFHHHHNGQLRANLTLLCLCVGGGVGMFALTNPWLSAAKRPVIAQLFGLHITTNGVQWVAMALGSYAAASWLQSLRCAAPDSFRRLASRSFIRLAIAGGLISCIGYSINAFLFAYVQAHFAKGPETGLTIGVIMTLTGAFGTIAGGIIGDWAKKIRPDGRVRLVQFAILCATISGLWQYQTDNYALFLILLCVTNSLMIIWLGPVSASCQDLVPAHLRGTATSVQLLGVNLIGLGLGPYLVGLISDATGSLGTALLSSFALIPIVLLLLESAARSLAGDEALANS